METINISQFMGYFGSYYPTILPVFVALCIISAYVLDLLRVWTIAYVDEGETGPYKRYVSTFLHKLVGNEPQKLAVGDLVSIREAKLARISDSPKEKQDIYYEYPMVHNGVEYFFYLRTQRGKAKILSEKYPHLSQKVFLDILDKGSLSKYCSDYEKVVWNPMDTAFDLFIWLVLAGALLAAYKFLPAITVGTIIGYCVLRLARSIVRLTKKFNKHISDGHGVKVEATEAKEML